MQVRALFTVGAIVLAFAVCTTSLAANEERWSDPHSASRKDAPGIRLIVSRIVASLASMGAPMRSLATVQFFSWLRCVLALPDRYLEFDMYLEGDQ